MVAMPGPYIDFISADCDRWCERCAFTARCSNSAVSSALATCDGNPGFDEAEQDGEGR